jgi:hypothetical protein
MSLECPNATLTCEQVVPEYSAVLGLPNEMIIPLNAHHRSICRFASTCDQNFILVKSAIADIISGKPATHRSQGEIEHSQPSFPSPYQPTEYTSAGSRLWRVKRKSLMSNPVIYQAERTAEQTTPVVTVSSFHDEA